MHDPSTVAHEIRYPWRKYRSKTPSGGNLGEVGLYHSDCNGRGDRDVNSEPREVMRDRGE